MARPKDEDRRAVQRAYGRYSATDQGDRRRIDERRRHLHHDDYARGEAPGQEPERDVEPKKARSKRRA